MVYRRKTTRRPYTRRYVRRTRRSRRVYKRFKKNSPSTSKFRAKGVPDQLFCKLKYAQTFNMAASAPLIAQQSFQSSAYDPDLTGFGHQPRYYDQLTPIYGKYQVLGMKVKYEVINATGGFPTRVVHAWTNGAPSVTALDQMAEGKHAFSKIVSTTGGMDRTTITSYMSAKKMFGLRTVINDEESEALVNATPANVFVSSLIAQSASTTQSVALNCNVMITYYVRFFQSLQGPVS